MASLITVANSRPPSPPLVRSTYPLADYATGITYYPFSLNANGNLSVIGTGRVRAPSSGMLSIQRTSPAYAKRVSLVSATAKVVGPDVASPVDIFGNAGGVLDAVVGNAQPANALQMGCAFNTTITAVGSGDLAANACDARGRLLIASINSPVTLSDSTGANKLAVDSSGRITTNDEMSWATGATVLTPTSATICTPILGNSVTGNLAQVINASPSAQTVTISLYRNEGASPTCSSADQIYAITLSSSASPLVSIPFTNGLAYTLSAAPAANIVVTYKQ